MDSSLADIAEDTDLPLDTIKKFRLKSKLYKMI